MRKQKQIQAVALGLVISHERRRRGMLETTLAKAARVTLADYRRFELGKTIPGAFQFKRIARRLRANMDCLLNSASEVSDTITRLQCR
jgi:transcriptional regulator with XRE-family HTH domain